MQETALHIEKIHFSTGNLWHTDLWPLNFIVKSCLPSPIWTFLMQCLQNYLSRQPMWKSEKKTFELCYSFQETLILFSNEAMYQKIFEVGELPSHCVWVGTFHQHQESSCSVCKCTASISLEFRVLVLEFQVIEPANVPVRFSHQLRMYCITHCMLKC